MNLRTGRKVPLISFKSDCFVKGKAMQIAILINNFQYFLTHYDWIALWAVNSKNQSMHIWDRQGMRSFFHMKIWCTSEATSGRQLLTSHRLLIYCSTNLRFYTKDSFFNFCRLNLSCVYHHILVCSRHFCRIKCGLTKSLSEKRRNFDKIQWLDQWNNYSAVVAT